MINKKVFMRVQELKRKEVINTCTCKVLGHACDIEFDLCTGCVHAIIVSGPSKWCGFVCSDCEYRIPISCITQVGPDIILVEVEENMVRQKIKMI